MADKFNKALLSFCGIFMALGLAIPAGHVITSALSGGAHALAGAGRASIGGAFHAAAVPAVEVAAAGVGIGVGLKAAGQVIS